MFSSFAFLAASACVSLAIGALLLLMVAERGQFGALLRFLSIAVAGTAVFGLLSLVETSPPGALGSAVAWGGSIALWLVGFWRLTEIGWRSVSEA